MRKILLALLAIATLSFADVDTSLKDIGNGVAIPVPGDGYKIMYFNAVTGSMKAVKSIPGGPGAGAILEGTTTGAEGVSSQYIKNRTQYIKSRVDSVGSAPEVKLSFAQINLSASENNVADDLLGVVLMTKSAEAATSSPDLIDNSAWKFFQDFMKSANERIRDLNYLYAILGFVAFGGVLAGLTYTEGKEAANKAFKKVAQTAVVTGMFLFLPVMSAGTGPSQTAFGLAFNKLAITTNKIATNLSSDLANHYMTWFSQEFAKSTNGQIQNKFGSYRQAVAKHAYAEYNYYVARYMATPANCQELKIGDGSGARKDEILDSGMFTPKMNSIFMPNFCGSTTLQMQYNTAASELRIAQDLKAKTEKDYQDSKSQAQASLTNTRNTIATTMQKLGVFSLALIPSVQIYISNTVASSTDTQESATTETNTLRTSASVKQQHIMQSQDLAVSVQESDKSLFQVMTESKNPQNTARNPQKVEESDAFEISADAVKAFAGDLAVSEAALLPYMIVPGVSSIYSAVNELYQRLPVWVTTLLDTYFAWDSSSIGKSAGMAVAKGAWAAVLDAGSIAFKAGSGVPLIGGAIGAVGEKTLGAAITITQTQYALQMTKRVADMALDVLPMLIWSFLIVAQIVFWVISLLLYKSTAGFVFVYSFATKDSGKIKAYMIKGLEIALYPLIIAITVGMLLITKTITVDIFQGLLLTILHAGANIANGGSLEHASISARSIVAFNESLINIISRIMTLVVGIWVILKVPGEIYKLVGAQGSTMIERGMESVSAKAQGLGGKVAQG